MNLTLISWVLAACGVVLLILFLQTHSALRVKRLEFDRLADLFDQTAVSLKLANNTIEQTRSVRDELISAVTHEIRTPLTCLSGYTQMMLERELPRELQVNYLTVVSRETHRLNSLLSDLLDIQCLETSGGLRLRSAQIADLLRETFDFFRNSDTAHRFILDIARPLPEIDVDARRIRQVVTNLVSNAVKYSPAGGEIGISACVPGRDLVVCVKDEGIGIPAEVIPRLFARFFRVNADRGGSIPGSGLGLALVKQCVEAHGGRVWVESTVGRGSAFYVSIPVSPVRDGGLEDEWRTSTPSPVYSKQ